MDKDGYEECENCEKKVHIAEITNYTIIYEDSVSFNCCSEECAKGCAEKQDIRENNIIRID